MPPRWNLVLPLATLGAELVQSRSAFFKDADVINPCPMLCLADVNALLQKVLGHLDSSKESGELSPFEDGSRNCAEGAWRVLRNRPRVG